MNQNRFSLVLVVLSWIFMSVSSLNAYNMPIFYRAQFFGGNPKTDHRNFVSFRSVRYGYGTAHKGYDRSGSTNILNIYGAVNINKLASNVENITAASKPTTFQFFSTPGTIPGFNFSGDDGTIELRGRFKIHEVDFLFHQNVIWDLFLEGYVPLRFLEIDGISFVNKTNQSNANAAAFQSFLTDNLDTVLQEHGLAPLKTPFHESGLGDISLALGWQGYSNTAFGSIIKDGNASLLIGAIFPTGSQIAKDNVVAIPIGYNGHWGIRFRGKGEASVLRYVVLGTYGGADIFLNQQRKLRLKTDTQQRGLILLEQGTAEVKPGVTWHLGLYLKLDRLWNGPSINFGYSFAQKERTRLTVKDDTFLQTFIATQTGTQTVNPTTKDEIVNSETRFGTWNMHTLHFHVEYDFAQHVKGRFAPKATFFYHYPVYGRHIFATDIIGGSAGITIRWQA